MSAFAFNSQVVNGSDWHCLLGSECTSSTMSAGVVGVTEGGREQVGPECVGVERPPTPAGGCGEDWRGMFVYCNDEKLFCPIDA